MSHLMVKSLKMNHVMNHVMNQISQVSDSKTTGV